MASASGISGKHRGASGVSPVPFTLPDCRQLPSRLYHTGESWTHPIVVEKIDNYGKSIANSLYGCQCWGGGVAAIQNLANRVGWVESRSRCNREMLGLMPPRLAGSGYNKTQHPVGEDDPSPAFNPTYSNLELLGSWLPVWGTGCFSRFRIVR